MVDIHRVSSKFVDDLLIAHLHHRIDFRIGSAVLLEHRPHLLTVYFGILNRHLSNDVEVQLKHLTNLLIKSHLAESLLNLRLQLGITGDSKLC